MRAIGAYLVAIAIAVAVGLMWMLGPAIRGFESATDNSLLQKMIDFALVTGFMYLLLLALVAAAVALPFAIALRILSIWTSGRSAAPIAGVVGSAVALVPLAALYRSLIDEGAFTAVFLFFLPIAAACGLVLGLCFTFLHRPVRRRSP